MTQPRHAAERVRVRIKEWCDREGHGSKTRLAEAVNSLFGDTKSRSWATDITSGGADLRLRDLDAVADLLDVPPGDLVRRPHDHYLEVTPTEMRLLRFFRALPDVIRGHWMAYVDYMFSFHERALTEQASERDAKTEAARHELARRKA